MKRERQVYPTERIPHLWYYGSTSARNPGGNFYYNGDTIYSYGSHFPIARKFKRDGYPDIVLFTRRGYSSTTSGHIWATRRAIPNSSEIMTVTDIEPSRLYCPLDWSKEFSGLMYELKEGLKAQLTARSKDHLEEAKSRLIDLLRLVFYFNGYKDSNRESAIPIEWGKHIVNPDYYVRELNDDVAGAFNPFNGQYIADNLIGWFTYAIHTLATKRGEDGPITEVEIYNGLTAGTWNNELLKNFNIAFDIPEMSAKRRTAVAPDLNSGTMGKAKAEKITRQIADIKEDIERWYRGERVRDHNTAGYAYLRELDPTLPEGQLLRIDPNDPTQVETNWGVKVPRKDAFLLYKWVRGCKERGIPPSKIPEKFSRISHYSVQHLSGEFKITIGCHLFTWAAVEKLAELAEWELALTSEE